MKMRPGINNFFPDILRKNVSEGVFVLQKENIMTASLEENMSYLKERLQPDVSFDIVYRVINVGGKQACIYFIDGFCKDELMQKLLQYFIDMKPEDMPENRSEERRVGKEC